MKLSVIGLGKLGACTAAAFAAKGFNVIGVDIDEGFVNKINSGKAPVFEPRLQELIGASLKKLTATQDYEEAIRHSDVTFLIVPTPSTQDGHFSDKYLIDALEHLAAALKKIKKPYHLFAVTSTVSPGTTEEVLIPLIENKSGKKLNKDFGVCYNPEFIALGSVINDFLRPDLVLIGESDKKAGDILEKIYKKACESSPYIARMSIVSAEVTKISLNSFVTMKISFANTLANICERIPGAEIDKITGALGADRRVSPYYLKGGLSYGGPCFPRDNRAFAAFARKFGIEARLAEATDDVNEFQVGRVVDIILNSMIKDNSIVAVLGLSYKPNTNVIEDSPGVKIIEELLKRKDAEVIVYDPLALPNARIYFGDKILYASSIEDCISNASICVIATADERFKSLKLKNIHKKLTLIDCWRLLDPRKLSDNARLISLGRKNG